MPIIGAKGSPSSQGFGQFAQTNAVANYIEDVFSTYLYTGNGSTQTITNGIDLSTKGGMVWLKSRSAGTDNFLFDTVRGALNEINSNTTNAQVSLAASLTAFNTTGFSLGAAAGINVNAATYTSWTFRKQPKFFDCVTWTGNGANRTIAHNLGSVPGCIMVKRTDTDFSNWQVYHRSNANTQYMALNSIGSASTGATRWNSTTPTDTVFSLGTDVTVNDSGGTYVAYLFAHNAGGFGLSGTDNVVSCDSYTGNGFSTGPVVTLGYEPQWVMVKNATSNGNWQIIDNMRGMPVAFGSGAWLQANLSNAESSNQFFFPTSTGFLINSASTEVNTNGSKYIYIAIRRGPMKVPTSGTSVFGLNARTGTGANATVTGGAGVSDAVLIKNRGAAVSDLFASRLTSTGYMSTDGTGVELAAATNVLQANPWDVMDGVKVGTTSTQTNASANTFINYLINRAPTFFDVVCYTGTGVARTISHNLATVPELMIVKSRSALSAWQVYSATVGPTKNLQLNTTNVPATVATMWNNTQPTSSVFTIGTNSTINTSGSTYINYLFATCAGVSKVGSYTGNGSSQTIACGFTAGARFVLIRRTDSTGDWYYWDAARGIVAGNDPYLSLNTSAAEVTTDDTIDTDSTGFVVNQVAATNVNVTSATYIFLAIA